MSGVEAAGILLSVFPLAISALEHWKQGFETLEDYWKFRRKFIRLINAVGLQSMRFRENIEELLTPIVDSDEELDEMLDDPRGEAWRDPDIEMALCKRLPKSYSWYCAAVEDLNYAMKELMDMLGIRDADTKWISYSSGASSGAKLDYQYKRIKITLSKKKLDQMLDDIAKQNDELEKILGISDRLAPIRRQRPSKLSASLQKIRQHACSLYDILSCGWRCSCKNVHEASLLLEQEPFPAEAKNEGYSLQVYFSAGTLPPPSNHWRHARIKCLNLDGEKDAKLEEAIAKISQLKILSEAKQNMLTKKGSKPVKKVGFQAEVKQEETVVAPIEIVDLCAAIVEHKEQTARFICADEEQRKRHLDVAFVGSLPQARTPVTLAQILQPSSPYHTRFSRKERVDLAVILASAVLQVHETAWLQPNWSKHDIIFLQDEHHILNFKQPFVTRHFLPQPPFSTALPKPPPDSRETLFRLGVLLLELCFNAALEDQPFRANYLGPDGRPNDFTDRATASKWMDAALGEGGPAFATAIRRCVDCAFGCSSMRLADAECRQAVLDGVVEPLRGVSIDFGG